MDATSSRQLVREQHPRVRRARGQRGRCYQVERFLAYAGKRGTLFPVGPKYIIYECGDESMGVGSRDSWNREPVSSLDALARTKGRLLSGNDML